MNLRSAIQKSVKKVTRDHTKAKRRAHKENRLSQQDLDHLSDGSSRYFIKWAAYDVMEEAYLKASANNTLPANARQIMYAARPLVLKQTNGACWKNSSYFTQHLLPDYMEEHRQRVADWDVVYDARGHFVEPHTEKSVALGTLDVRKYLRDWQTEVSDDHGVDLGGHSGVPTCGPAHRYEYALFIEKEGFDALLKASKIAQRYDLAIMSTKGMSNTSARQLVEAVSDAEVTVLIARDLDVAGFSIAETLQSDTRRYQFHSTPHVINLGLRLEDAEAMSLGSEAVTYKNRTDPRVRLRECGATEEECQFLVSGRGYPGFRGKRIELNAMASDQFIEWLEGALERVGVTKVVPNAEVLAAAYRRAVTRLRIQRLIENADETTFDIPDDLVETVQAKVEETSEEAWDDAVWALVQDGVEEGDEP